MEAAEQESLRKQGDPLCSHLAGYYHKHTKEEFGHDEWLLADLEIIGVSRGDVETRKPIQAVSELVGSQYYWIHHWHPVCLLGYIAFSEGYPARRKDIDELIVRTGYPEAAFRTLAKHSYLDLGHRDDLDNVLDGLPMESRHEEWITLNAMYTAKKCAEILASL